MPTADFSSYHQPSGSAADGTKFDNFIDAVQTTVNGLDKNNLAANAGILASQLADPTTGKVLGSSGSACAAVYPPSYEFGYKEFTSSVTSTATTAAGAVAVVTADAVTFDGSTTIWVEFFCPGSVAGTGALTAGKLEIYEASTDICQVCEVANDAASNNQEIPILVRRKLTPAAGARTYSIRGWASIAGGYTWRAGTGGSGGTLVPGYIRITKA